MIKYQTELFWMMPDYTISFYGKSYPKLFCQRFTQFKQVRVFPWTNKNHFNWYFDSSWTWWKADYCGLPRGNAAAVVVLTDLSSGRSLKIFLISYHLTSRDDSRAGMVDRGYPRYTTVVHGVLCQPRLW